MFYGYPEQLTKSNIIEQWKYLFDDETENTYLMMKC